MLRKTFTILSLIGLLLSVGLWGASYLQWGIMVDRYHLQAINGVLQLSRADTIETAEEIEATFSYLGMSNFRVGGRCYLFSSQWRLPINWFGLPGRYRNTWGAGIFVPLWMWTVTFGFAFCLCRPVQQYRRRKRKELGLCLKCGYDLRGSKERCPECGAGFSN